MVLERWPEPYPMPRAVHFDDEVARILQACGIGAALDDDHASRPTSTSGATPSGTTLRPLRQRRHGPRRVAAVVDVQPAGARSAARGAGPRPADDRRAPRGRGRRRSTQDDDGVTIRARRSRRRRRRRCAAATRSGATVPTARCATCSASPVDDLGFFYDWLIVDVILDEPRVFDPINLQVCDPARPTTVVSGGPGRRRWEFMRLPDETLDDLNDVDAGVEAARPLGRAPRQRHARAPRGVHVQRPSRRASGARGRVLLAGDAAHLMPPFAGPGHVLGHPRRRQPGVEARPACSPAAATPTLLDTLRRRSGCRTHGP